MAGDMEGSGPLRETSIFASRAHWLALGWPCFLGAAGRLREHTLPGPPR